MHGITSCEVFCFVFCSAGVVGFLEITSNMLRVAGVLCTCSAHSLKGDFCS